MQVGGELKMHRCENIFKYHKVDLAKGSGTTYR